MNYFEEIMNGNFNPSTDEVVMEAYYPENIPYMKTTHKFITLPQGTPIGKGNLCLLYTKDQDESIKVIKNTSNFVSKNKYRYYYYNFMYRGVIYNRRFKFKELDSRKSYYETIEKETSLQARKVFPKESDNRNLYYELFRFLEIFESIAGNLSPNKYIKEYWTFMKNVYNQEIFQAYQNKFVLVNLNYFKITKKLKENLTNPLYIIYYTLLRNPDLIQDLNLDFYFYADKFVLKINPSMLNKKDDCIKLKQEMFKLINRSTPDPILQVALDDTEITKDEITSNTAAKILSVMNVNNGAIISTNEELNKVKMNASVAIQKEIESKAKDRVSKTVDAVNDVSDKPDVSSDATKQEVIEDTVTSNIKNEIDEDRALVEKIYYQTKRDLPQKSTASTARDKMLREKQKDLVVGEMTIDQIEKIKTDNIPIPETDLSGTLKGINENMKKSTFMNFNKEYDKKVMKKDIVNAVLSLNDKSIPMFIRDIKVEDTSDELNYKETYTISMEDSNRKRHTIKVDIPKFIDDSFLYIGGNKKLLKNQNFYMPVVKINNHMVQIVTNYSKMTIDRVDGNKSISSIERIRKLTKTSEEALKYFTIGNAFSNNKDAITTLEYDDLSKTFTSFKCGKTFIMFDQVEVDKYMKDHNIPAKEGKMYIGKDNGKDSYIDIDTQMDEFSQTISDIIILSLPDEIASDYKKMRAPKRMLYARVRVMSQFVSVGMLLGFWEGISTVLKKMNLKYRLEDKVPPQLGIDENFIKFEDCVMIYEETVPIALLLNGFKQFDTENYKFMDFDEKLPYLDYIKKKYGKAIIENALMNFYEFMIDPITKEILIDNEMPTDIVSLMIYALNLLSDSQHVPDINQNLARIRRNEVIPAILYEKLAKAYVQYRTNNGRNKYSIPQDAVIKELLALKTVEDYSTLNPTLEMQQLHSLSSKGFNGVNLDKAYTVPKRCFDPSMIGVVAPVTSPDGQCGVSKYLSLEPNITNLRGYTKDAHEDLDSLKDVNLFSPGELTIPLGSTVEDPNRLGHAVKQSSHVIPVKDSSPVLISNGMEEAARFHLTSNFVINAEEDGEIVDYNEEANIMMAKYKSGKCQAINLEPNIVKNAGGGFFLSNRLTTDLKVGDKFKKNSVLAYHKDYFKNDEFNNCRMVMGTLAKIAIMSTYNTYEDATCITESLSERCSTEMVFCKSAVIGKNANIFYMVKKGQHIQVGDPLVQFDTSYEDETINALLANLAKDEKEDIIESARNEIKSKYSGVIEDIKIYPTIDTEEMSPSLRKVVNEYYKGINDKKKFLDKYDPADTNSIVKCGMLMNEVSHKITPNKFGVIKGEHVEDSVLIEFYIKHSEPLEVGSKIAHFTALKNTVGEVIPEGYEPWSEFRPEEEVSSLIASNSILNRMTPSILLTALGNKCIIELKRKLETMNYDRPKMEALIYKFFSAMDKTGDNTKKYKNLFQPMSDTQFKKYFKDLFANKYAYLILEIVDYERTVNMDDIEKAAKVLNIPLYEHVMLPHLTMDKSRVVVTQEPVPVGYYPIKRTQQTVMKKNGLSTDIKERSGITGQVTGHDKNGRMSDLENIMLTSLGMKNALKEFNAPRADDSKMKSEMLRDISTQGYTRLEDMTDDISNKTTLNTVNTYILGMSIESDLVTKGLMLDSTLKKEL